MDRQIITVDIAPGSNAQQRLQVSQGDIGRPLGVRIIQNGLPLNCTGYTAHLYVLKPDHNYYECTCTISNNNLISWDTAEQETPVAGECLAEIRITSGTNDIGTACFVEYVEASPADLGYASESLISSMTEFVDAAQRAAEEATEVVADADNVSDVAIDSSGHIVLSKVHGSTVTSDETVLQPGDIENDLLATTAGKVLDARQGKALKDLIGDAVYVNLQQSSSKPTITEAIEAVWDQIPAGKAFVGQLYQYGRRAVWGYKYPSANNAGVCVSANYNGSIDVTYNDGGVFTSHDISNKVATGTIAAASQFSGMTMDMIVCRKVGNIATVSGRIYGISETPMKNFFVLPSGFRPAFDIYCNGYVTIVGEGSRGCAVHIYPNGNVYFGYSSSATANQVFFFATYPI